MGATSRNCHGELPRRGRGCALRYRLTSRSGGNEKGGTRPSSIPWQEVPSVRAKVALLTGVTGQDGAYLARFLLKNGYIVHGMKRRLSSFNTRRVDKLYVDRHEGVTSILHALGDLTDATNIIRLIQGIKTQGDLQPRSSKPRSSSCSAISPRLGRSSAGATRSVSSSPRRRWSKTTGAPRAATMAQRQATEPAGQLAWHTLGYSQDTLYMSETRPAWIDPPYDLSAKPVGGRTGGMVGAAIVRRLASESYEVISLPNQAVRVYVGGPARDRIPLSAVALSATVAACWSILEM